ncbi:hypothetical protein [Novosphingobium sp. PhB165]|uniref:hypothetical protein n=1 Tax=Novosphingobium sp. PhB165 TaxID=2485105 RepID=UPI001047FFC0|nr:hypothetical protein [Novosphingobium sp. PhB165]
MAVEVTLNIAKAGQDRQRGIKLTLAFLMAGDRAAQNFCRGSFLTTVGPPSACKGLHGHE